VATIDRVTSFERAHDQSHVANESQAAPYKA
jgi:hypothetical protein